MKYSVAFLSDTGRVRSLNEDNLRVERPTQPEIASKWGDLYVVADGMGGHESGEVASEIAIETISESYYRINGPSADAALKKAIEQANSEIFRRAQEEDRQGMGTTVVAAVRIDRMLYIAHVGDSRMYLIRDGQIKPLTQDHSMVQEQVAAGILTPEEAEKHPYRNVISRAVGTSPAVEVEVSQSSPLELRDGDVVLLCSDGLTEHVKPPTIRQIVANRAAESAAAALIQAANNGGGSDNISVIVLRVGEVKQEGDTTAFMPIGDTPTEPNPVLSPAPAPAAAGAPPAQRGGEGGGWGRWITTLIILMVAGGLGWYGLTQSGFFAPPVSATSTPSAPTVTTAPLPTGTVRPTRAPTRTPTATPIPEATLAPLPTLPPAVN